MEKRVFGTECEYALFLQSPYRGSGEKGAREVLHGKALAGHLEELSAFLVLALGNLNLPLAGEFLGNGGRFYIDRGHPEYATPECRSVKDLVSHEKAGDRTVQRLIQEARLLMAQKGIPGKLHAFKNNFDPYGNSYGSHENYLVTPQAMGNIQAIIPFLVTRQIFTGAGKITGIGGKARHGVFGAPFQLTQRADFIDHVFSDRTTQMRGIINTRKRDIPRHGENIRLHVILGDSNMSDYAIALKIGVTAMLLRLLEEDALHNIPHLSQPVNALKETSINHDSLLEMEGQKCRYTALDIQCLYLEKAQRFFSIHEPDSESRELLSHWEGILNALNYVRLSKNRGAIEDDPYEARRRIDWLLKFWLSERARKKSWTSWDEPNLRLMDFRYHDLDPHTGLFERCRTLDLVDWLAEEEEIVRAESDPPGDTRACMRGLIIQESMNKEVEVIVKNWESIKILAGRAPHSQNAFDRHKRMINCLQIKLNDPFESRNPALMTKVREFIHNQSIR